MTHNYVDPVVQPLLQNVFGVELQDIARSIGVRFHDLKRRFEEIFEGGRFSHPEFNYHKIVAVNGKNGKQVTSYVLDMNTVKFLMARYNTQIGNGYLAYLILFESEKKQNACSSESEHANDPVIKLIRESYVQARKYRLAQLCLEKKTRTIQNRHAEARLEASRKLKASGKPRGVYTISEYSRMYELGISSEDYRHIGHRAMRISREQGLVPHQLFQNNRKKHRYEPKVLKAAIKEHILSR